MGPATEKALRLVLTNLTSFTLGTTSRPSLVKISQL